MPLTRDQLREHIRRGETSPVYVLYGSETYLRDKAVETIVKRSFGEGDFRDFNDNKFELTHADDLEPALLVARQLPMMSARRVVTISGLKVSATGYRDTVVEDHEDLINGYLNDPSPESIVIFVADELNGVRRMGKLLRSQPMAVEFAPLTEKELPEQTRKAFKEAGAEIDPDALREFIARSGTDLHRLNNEVKKLSTAALPANVITRELVENLVPDSRAVENYAITDAIVAGRGREAVRLLEKALDDGAEPLMLLGLLGNNYRQLLAAKDLMDRGADRSEVQRALKMPPFKQEPFLAAARRVDIKKLEIAIRRLAETDVAIKTSLGGSGKEGARQQIELLVCELALL